MSEVKYKSMVDHVYIEVVPSHYVGYDNPAVTIRVKRDMEEWKQEALRGEIADAILRWGAITGHAFKAEIKPQ
jgi:hypothetical protein